LRTLTVLGVHGVTAMTAVIAQANSGVRRIEPVSTEMLLAQLDALAEDLPIDFAKIGMLATRESVQAVDHWLQNHRVPFLVDPVLRSSSGHDLLAPDALDSLRKLVGHALLVTPNCAELAVLLNVPNSVHRASELVSQGRQLLQNTGAHAVLAKGGHLKGDPIDVLITRNGQRTFEALRVETPCVRGTGCTLSAAIAAHIARGESLENAVEEGKAFVHRALELSVPIGIAESPMDVLAASLDPAIKGA
jgi:hydroxymethylpyrimidine/phosphomethylpyrimidine kinase